MGLIINGQVIDADVLDQEFSSIKASFEQLNPFAGCCERDEEFRGYARNNIVARVLLTQEAERRIDSITDAEVDTALQKLKDEHGGETQFYIANGVGPEQEDLIRSDLAMNLRVKTLIDEVCADLPEPTEQDLSAYYEQNLDRYMTEERLHAIHILRAPARGEDRAEAYEQMRQARRRLLDGEDFEAVARDVSDKVREYDQASEEERAQAHDPIDLGTFKRGELMEEFELVAFSLRVGEISPVFGTSFGFHIVKVVEHEPAIARPLDEVRDEVLAHFTEQQRGERLQQFVKTLEADATIEQTDDDGEGACDCSSH